MEQDFEKLKISVRYWLQGKEWFKALEAMHFAESFHTGKRKDGSHEFSHQVSQVAYAKTLIKSLRYPEETICTIFLHDVCEDYDISYEEIEARFGKLVRDAVELMTKFHRGDKKDPNTYYKSMAKHEIASFAKGCDRIHNHYTMLNGFKPEKQKSYIAETYELIIPMLKEARRLFPSQEPAYENVKFMLANQMMLYTALTDITVATEN